MDRDKKIIKVSIIGIIVNIILVGFKGENKKNRIDKVFKNFQIGFVFSGLSLLLILTIYIMLILRIHNIEIYFIGKLLNFNSPNFNIYLKKLEEIKKKLRNDNNDEDDKEDIDYDSESKKDSKGVEDEKKNDIAKKDINTHKNKKINEKQQKQKRDQIKIIIGYFLKNNLIFGIKIILIMILSLSYYIISIMIGNKSEYLLTSTLYSIEVWERIIPYSHSQYEVYSHRKFLKQDGDSFYYGFITNHTKNYMQILRMKLEYDDSGYFEGIKIMDISNYVKVMAYEEMISCDLTEDKENILCIYILD